MAAAAALSLLARLVVCVRFQITFCCAKSIKKLDRNPRVRDSNTSLIFTEGQLGLTYIVY